MTTTDTLKPVYGPRGEEIAYRCAEYYLEACAEYIPEKAPDEWYEDCTVEITGMSRWEFEDCVLLTFNRLYDAKEDEAQEEAYERGNR